MNIHQLAYHAGLPPVATLRAGRLECLYERGNLRNIRYGGSELIRMIYAAVRNENWQTLPYTIENEKVETDGKTFAITYTAWYGQMPQYKAAFSITGNENRVNFLMQGEAMASFLSNRIGLCLHYPVQACRNQPVSITRPDGSTYKAVFPDEISPHQPFKNISRMAWQTSGRTRVSIQFHGEVFETEDQRNWTDSSYKTYSTPLDLPFPVAVRPGQRMEQQISIEFEAPAANAATVHPKPATKREERKVFPLIGFSQPHGLNKATEQEMQLIQSLPFHHYRVALASDDPEWEEELDNALELCQRLQVKLALISRFSSNFRNECRALINRLADAHNLVYSILPVQKNFDTTPKELLARTYPILKKAMPHVMIGYGTEKYFTQLNRQRPPLLPYDFISFAANPQVHATDNRSILQNLENQPDLVDTAAVFAPGTPVFVSPLTFNDHLLNGPDDRVCSALAAAWTLISLQNFAGISSITLGDLFGKESILQKPGQNGMHTSPLADTLKLILDFAPKWIIRRLENEKLLTDGLMLENSASRRLFIEIKEMPADV